MPNFAKLKGKAAIVLVLEIGILLLALSAAAPTGGDLLKKERK